MLLRYYGSWIPWPHGENFDVEGLAEVIRKGKEVEILSGIDRVTDRCRQVPGLPFRWEKKRPTHFARLDHPEALERLALEPDFSIPEGCGDASGVIR